MTRFLLTLALLLLPVLAHAGGMKGGGSGASAPCGSSGAIQYNNGGACGSFGSWASSVLTVPGSLSVNAAAGAISSSATGMIVGGDWSYNAGSYARLNEGIIIDVHPPDGSVADVVALRGTAVTFLGDTAAPAAMTGLYANVVHLAATLTGGIVGLRVDDSDVGAGASATTVKGIEVGIQAASVEATYGIHVRQQSYGPITYGLRIEQVLSEAASTPGYPFWYDSLAAAPSGVSYIRQALNGNAPLAFHNPSVAKYTPGAANFERLIFGEWSTDNIARIQTEAGGTGTLRELQVSAADITFAPASGSFLNVTREIKLTNQTTTVGASAGTITNAPVAGNPVAWVRVFINGTERAIPAWALP